MLLLCADFVLHTSHYMLKCQQASTMWPVQD